MLARRGLLHLGLALAAGCAAPVMAPFGGGPPSGDGGKGNRDGYTPSGRDAGPTTRPDLAVDPCAGKDPMTDPMNCGRCMNACMAMNVAVNTCVNGQCAIGMCAMGYYDLDGMAQNGCECQGDAMDPGTNNTCMSSLDSGTVTDAMSTMITLSGKLLTASDSRWYQIHSTDAPVADHGCNNYDLKIKFADNPNMQFRFDVMYYDCISKASCGGMGETPFGLTEYEWKAGGGANGPGECPCVNNGGGAGMHTCMDHSQVLRIHVYRVMGMAPTCDSFKLQVTNGG